MSQYLNNAFSKYQCGFDAVSLNNARKVEKIY